MFEVVICVSILVLSFVSVIVEVKRLKAVKENTKVYKDLEGRFIKMREDIQISLKAQQENSISFDELVERLEKTMKERLGDPKSR